MKRFIILFSIITIFLINVMKGVEYHWEVKDADTSIHYGNIAGKSKTHIVTYSLNANRGGTFYFTDLNLENPKTIDIINPKDLYLFDACMTEDNRLFVVADSGYILTNTINDEGWQYTKIFDVSEAITTIAFRDKDYGVAVNNGNELYSTSDGGTTWVVMPEQVDDFPANYLISRARFEGNTLFLIIYDFATKLYYTKMSLDSGTTWEKAALIDNELFYPVDYYYDNGKWWLVGRKSTGVGHLQYSIIINSNDNGKTWSRQLYVDDGIRGGIFSIQFFDDSNEGLAVNPLKVYYTSDGGENWEILADTLSNPDSLRTLKGKLLKIDNEMYIIGYDRIIKFVKSPNSINENNFQNELFSVSPNPTHDFITIQLSNKGLKPFAGEEKVQLFDVLGIEVMSVGIGLDLSTQRIDVSHLPAGVYFIRIGTSVEKFVKM
jgi:photosystem II stability/assembly factor-like uncharacterized protein